LIRRRRLPFAIHPANNEVREASIGSPADKPVLRNGAGAGEGCGCGMSHEWSAQGGFFADADFDFAEHAK
jgi:hypothetical protein